ncbi:MAG: cytochrome c [Chlorobi bacterium]|nr:cytochrome c [Chlorobiota bacterium]
MMKKYVLATVLLGGFIGTLFLAAKYLGVEPDRLNYEYFPDMARNFAYKAQSPNPFFRNGRTEQRPVEGAIARGFMPLHYGLSEEEAKRAGRELRNPFKSDSTANLERGKRVYEIYCGTCHGAAGDGKGLVVQHGYPAPPSLLLENARAIEDGRMFYIITYGFKNMPAYGSQVAHDDRWYVINFIRQLQENQQ